MTILVNILPANARRYVYAAWAFLGLALGTWAVMVASVATWALPDVYTALQAGYAFASVALGLTAFANANGEVYELPEDDGLPVPESVGR